MCRLMGLDDDHVLRLASLHTYLLLYRSDMSNIANQVPVNPHYRITLTKWGNKAFPNVSTRDFRRVTSQFVLVFSYFC